MHPQVISNISLRKALMEHLKFNLLFVLLVFSFGSVAHAADPVDESRITDEVLPPQTDLVPNPPGAPIELGNPFLESGQISQGFTLPTGAVWQPSLMIWGTYRTALQSFDNGKDRTSEWANRFDLFSNLYLTQSERILLGIRPLDKNGRFTRYTFDSPDESAEGKFREEFNSKITTLFFEGDFGELFPVLDPHDKYGLDFGIGVGRQPLSFQEGMLLNDTIDSLGVSKINLKTPGVINHRLTLLWGWGDINRNNLSDDDNSAALYGFSNEIDIPISTIEVDGMYLDSDTTGNSLHGGIGAIQRFGAYNTTFRLLGSHANGAETAASKDGTLLFGEVSRTLSASKNFIYLSAFWGIDKFRSASRGPSAGGPLAPAGVLFEAVGLGSYRAALDSTADDAVGAALGYQLFAPSTRWHLITELGTRYATRETGQRAEALGLSLQGAVGTRSVLRFDLYTRYGKDRAKAEVSDDEKFAVGGRVEWSYRL